MTDDPRLLPLLEELLASQSTPEQVCMAHPDLLPQLRRQWRQMRRVRAELDRLFPPATDAAPQPPRHDMPLPALPGYTLDAELGRGGVGVVYRATDQRLHRAVAVKMLLAGPCATPDELERFLREAKAVARLQHPNVVQLYEAGEVEGRPYFTMELVEGGSLAQHIRGEPQPARQAAALVATLADAVHAAHQSGIVHRDLKPGNVLLASVVRAPSSVVKDNAAESSLSLTTDHGPRTTDLCPKITDFGLARHLEGGDGLTLSGTPMGTPSYMAPEQARGEKGIGPAVDVYALGAILYECLTGRPPFRGETAAATIQQVLADDPVPPARLNTRVPRDLETICLKCLEKEPHRRYRAAAALADDLRRQGRGEPIAARPAGRVERAAKWARRRPTAVALLAAGLLLAIALVGASLWLVAQRRPATRGHRGRPEGECGAARRRPLGGRPAGARPGRGAARLGWAGRPAPARRPGPARPRARRPPGGHPPEARDRRRTGLL